MKSIIKKLNSIFHSNYFYRFVVILSFIIMIYIVYLLLVSSSNDITRCDTSSPHEMKIDFLNYSIVPLMFFLLLCILYILKRNILENKNGDNNG